MEQPSRAPCVNCPLRSFDVKDPRPLALLEEHVDAFLRSLEGLRAPNDVLVFDIGANNGAWSRAMLQEIWKRNPTARVALHLFEPQPSMWPSLDALTAFAQRDGGSIPSPSIRINRAAASVRDGEATFWLSHNSEMASLHQQAARWHRRQNVTARTVNLDAYLDEVIKQHATERTAIFLKMDVEGAEFELLPHLFRRPGGPACRIGYWLVEWHLWNSNKSPAKIEVRRSLDARAGSQCRGAAGLALRLPERVVDHDEYYSMNVT